MSKAGSYGSQGGRYIEHDDGKGTTQDYVGDKCTLWCNFRTILGLEGRQGALYKEKMGKT